MLSDLLTNFLGHTPRTHEGADLRVYVHPSSEAKNSFWDGDQHARTSVGAAAAAAVRLAAMVAGQKPAGRGQTSERARRSLRGTKGAGAGADAADGRTAPNAMVEAPPTKS